MKIVVTGATGFIGNAISRDLISRNHQVIACTGRSGSGQNFLACRSHNGSLIKPAFSQLLAIEQPDLVIHCAGSASVGVSISDPLGDYHNNVVLTRELYRYLAENSPTTRVIFLSSAAVYGQPESLPINELTPCNPISPYGRHKLECEEIAKLYHRSYGLNVLNLRIFSAYGPGMKKQILWDIYNKSKLSRRIELLGDGSETRDFIYIQDVVEIIRTLAEAKHWKRPAVNVASGESVTVRSIAEEFLSLLNFSGELYFSGQVAAGSPRFWCANASTKQELGLGASTARSAGLREYIQWLSRDEGADHSHRVLARAG